MQRDHRALLLEYGYPEELVSAWSAEDCAAKWEEFCSEVIPE